jgi:hypothetical protein
MNKHLSLILIILFTVSIMPLLVISIYNWPSIDDFRFSIQTRQAMSAAGFPVYNVLKAAATTAASSYLNWQGTFSAIFLMALQPSVFSARAYILVPIILIGVLIFATFCLLSRIITDCLHLERKYVIYIGIPMLFLQIQFVPSTVQAFFWYNGAMYYTFFYSLMLIYMSELIHLYFNGEKKFKKSLIISIILAVVLGGGNFVTALLTFLIGLGFVVFSLFNHSKQQKRIWRLILPEIILLIAFVISMVAPGNAVRQAYFPKMSPLQAICRSIFQAMDDIKNWTTPTVIIICLVLIPVMDKIAKKMKFQFRWPGMWIIATFLLFAAQNAPTLYAQSFVGPSRMRNIIYYSFIWFLFFNLTYCIGWLQKTYSSLFSQLSNFVAKRFEAKEIISTKNLIVSLLLILLVAVNLNLTSLKKVSSVVCASDLVSGRATAYNKQLSERQSILENTQIDVVKVPALKTFPKSLYLSDMSGNPNYWTNKSMAAFYNKKSVETYPNPNVKKAKKTEAADEPVIFK